MPNNCRFYALVRWNSAHDFMFEMAEVSCADGFIAYATRLLE